jgi:hypothetical protein
VQLKAPLSTGVNIFHLLLSLFSITARLILCRTIFFISRKKEEEDQPPLHGREQEERQARRKSKKDDN